MFSFTNLLIGLAMMAVGVAFVKWTFQIGNFTGRQEWIERFVGSGMTFGVYKIFGVLLVILGTLIATGFLNQVETFLFSPLIRIFRPPTA